MDPDTLMLIGLYLDLEDVFSYCLVNKKFNRSCYNKNFWLERLKNEPDYLFDVVMIFDYNYNVLEMGTYVLSISKYIPNRDVITIIQTINERILTELGIDNMVVNYDVRVNNIVQCDSNLLIRECFSDFNRYTQQVIIGVKLNQDIELEPHMILRRKFNTIQNTVMKEYKESLIGTNKEYLSQYLRQYL
jgi:hypothetical protein